MQMDEENYRAWYVIQTVTGLEDSAKINLERRIVSLNMQDYVFQIVIPTITRMEKKKNGELKEVVEKLYPGYLFVDMIVTDETWFNVRNTPMVTGFLGSSGGGAKPVPLTNEEIIPILKQCGIEIDLHIDFKVGDTVEIIAGSFAGQSGVVDSIDMENQMVTVLIDFFGRETPTELNFTDIKAC